MYFTCANKVDKPDRLIIRLSFGFVSDSVSRKNKYGDGNAVYSKAVLELLWIGLGLKITGYSASEFWLYMKVRKLIRLSINP